MEKKISEMIRDLRQMQDIQQQLDQLGYGPHRTHGDTGYGQGHAGTYQGRICFHCRLRVPTGGCHSQVTCHGLESYSAYYFDICQ